MKLIRNPGFILIVFLFGLKSYCRGWMQEITLYFTDGREHLSYDSFDTLTQGGLSVEVVKMVNRYCSRGIWNAYTVNVALWTPNPEAVFYKQLGVGNDSEFHCADVDLSSMKSMYRVGAIDTTMNQLRLYPLRSQIGLSYPVSRQINSNMEYRDREWSLSATGTLDYMLFEGPYLNGNSYCLAWEKDIYIRVLEVADILPGGKVRSVAVGCKEKEIAFYRQQYIQELLVYSNAQVHKFESVANINTTGLNFTNIDFYCSRGMWQFFEGINFRGKTALSPWPRTGIDCYKPVIPVASFRHWGAVNMTWDSLSLYSEDKQSGDEILVTAQEHKNITIRIRSLAGTGTASWSLYEGQNFDGRKRCTSPSIGQEEFFFVYPIRFEGLKTVGSVRKGCS